MYNNYSRPQGGNSNYNNKGYSPTQQPLQPQINKHLVFDFEHISAKLFSDEAEKYAIICAEPINKKGKAVQFITTKFTKSEIKDIKLSKASVYFVFLSIFLRPSTFTL